MLARFLADAIDEETSSAHLGADEARHLSQVLRLGAGDEVAVFDGAGHEFRARVERLARDGADLRLIGAIEPAPEPAVRLTLAQAILKGEKMDDVVRDATMMGVAAIQPLITSHTVAHVKPGAAPERWTRIAIASAKQCRRAVVPRIGPALPFLEWLEADHSAMRILLLEPAAEHAGRRAAEHAENADATAAEHAERAELRRKRAAEDAEHADRRAAEHAERADATAAEHAEHADRRAAEHADHVRNAPASASLLVGPEGGWSAEEIEAAVAAGLKPLTLGRRTLRADAVATVAIGVLQYVWGDL